jgi:hypothetical protein
MVSTREVEDGKELGRLKGSHRKLAVTERLQNGLSCEDEVKGSDKNGDKGQANGKKSQAKGREQVGKSPESSRRGQQNLRRSRTARMA